MRKQKSEKEEKYFGKVDQISNKKFEDLKKQALGPGTFVSSKNKNAQPVIEHVP